MEDKMEISPKVKSLSNEKHARELAKTGRRTLPGAYGTFWIRHCSGTMIRIPSFSYRPPENNEMRMVLLKGPAVSISYIVEPDEQHPANTWLYICTNREYKLDKLKPAMRRNVRRGLKELKITRLTSKELLTHGVQTFCDTRRRVGLNDGTLEEFKRRFTLRAKCSGHVFLGAWKDTQLVAFLSITEVDDWAEIEGCFSMNAHLKLRPNDTLLFSALYHYLVEEKLRVVSYGLSSLQADSNEAGLHAFKTKVGFRAKPVHRAFLLHPVLRPFINRLVLWGVNTALSFNPKNPLLKKADGMLDLMLNEKKL